LKRIDKLELSSSAEYIYGFKQGIFIKFYEKSLYRFIKNYRDLKPMLEKVKNSQPIVYGGLPLKSFTALTADQGLRQGLEITDQWLRWPFGGSGDDGEQVDQDSRHDYKSDRNDQGDGEELEYQKWRSEVMAADQREKQLSRECPSSGVEFGGDSRGVKSKGDEDRNILLELAEFDLAVSAPVQTMNKVMDQQNFLRNRKKTC
jgi:hypothetical protein